MMTEVIELPFEYGFLYPPTSMERRKTIDAAVKAKMAREAAFPGSECLVYFHWNSFTAGPHPLAMADRWHGTLKDRLDWYVREGWVK